MKTFNTSLVSTNQKPKKEEEALGKIWTSEKITEVQEYLAKGKLHPLGNPFFEKIVGLRNSNVTYEYSEDEIEEIIKCSEDIIYFAEKYCQIKTENGQYEHFKLRPYQKKALKKMMENDYLIYLASRQIGKTVMTSIFMLWYLCFNTEKNVLAVANKDKTVVEIVDKVKKIYKRLPFFLQPGIVKWNEGEISFDNDCRLSTSATTEDAGVGFTIDFLYADEFAKVPNNIARRFWASIYPTISSIKNGKCIITSTADGFNLFYEIYMASLSGKNEFGNHLTTWDEVPGRDEIWKQREIANLGEGGEDIFNREYECKFQEGSDILLDTESLATMKENKKTFQHIIIDEFEELGIPYKNLKWAPDLGDLSNERKFVLTIDLSLGVGLDYSVITICEIIKMTKEEIEQVKNPIDEKDFLKLSQVGIWSDNVVDIKTVAEITMGVVRFLGEENSIINFETNQGGDYFLRSLEDDEDFYGDIIVYTKHKKDSPKERPGVKISQYNKVNYCNELKNLIRKKRFVVYDEDTVEEFTQFGKNKKGSYSNDSGNDDKVMSWVNLVPSIYSFTYQELSEDVINSYDKELLDLIYSKISNSENSEYVDYSKVYDGIDIQMEMNRIYNNPFGSYKGK